MGNEADAAPLIVVMGVSAVGKTSVATELAGVLGIDWFDADDLHSESNVAKMASGQALNDDDRWPWLDAVASELAAGGAQGGRVVACSALRRVYRDRLRKRVPSARFVHLVGSRELLETRIAGRTGHYMPASLLGSQLDTLEALEPDEDGVALDVTVPVDAVVDAAARWIAD